jgi:carboxyl-terminal processing protease
MKGAYTGLLSELDPFSEYLSSEEHDQYVAARAATGNAAAPADTGLRVLRREGVLLVVAVRKGSDAEARGITPGDQLRRIGDQSTREMNLLQVQSALEGASGSSVALTLLRREEPHKLDANVERRPAPDEPAALTVIEGKEPVGLLRIPHFRKGMAAEVAALLAKPDARRVSRMLIDLRGNAWGSMDEAAQTAGLFVGDTVVARLKARDDTAQEVRSGRGKAAWDGIVAILINGSTAESAELFAEAVREGHPAALVGEGSFGVGAQQDLIPLRNGAWLKLSVRKYVSAGGTAWHGTGLTPDTSLPAGTEGAYTDRLAGQLDKAVEFLRGYKPGTAGIG